MSNINKNNPPVPLAVGGALLKNEEMIRDAFNRDVKTIKNTANLLLIREIVIFLTAGLVLAGTIAGTWYYYHKRNQAAKIAFQMKQEQKMLEDEARKQAEIARKKTWEEERLARENERKRLEAERLAKDEVRKQAELRRKKYIALTTDYRELELDYLQNAPKEILPAAVKVKTEYSCLMADDTDKMTFFRVTVVPGQPMTVQQLSPDSDPVDVPKAVFDERCKNESYLMIADGRPYVKARKRISRSYPIPHEDGSFCPAMEDLGTRLYNVVRSLNLKTKFICYEVVLQPKDAYRFELDAIQMEPLSFDKSFSLYDFQAAVRRRLEKKAAENEDSYRRTAASRSNGRKIGRDERALKERVAASRAGLKPTTRTSSTTIIDQYGRVVGSRTTTRTSGPTRNQLENLASDEARLRSLQDKSEQQHAREQQRRMIDDNKFYRENEVTLEKINKLLNCYVITFHLAK